MLNANIFWKKIYVSSLSNSTQKLLWFEITKMLIAVLKINCVIYYNCRHTSVPYVCPATAFKSIIKSHQKTQMKIACPYWIKLQSSFEVKRSQNQYIVVYLCADSGKLRHRFRILSLSPLSFFCSLHFCSFSVYFSLPPHPTKPLVPILSSLARKTWWVGQP